MNATAPVTERASSGVGLLEGFMVLLFSILKHAARFEDSVGCLLLLYELLFTAIPQGNESHVSTRPVEIPLSRALLYD